MARIPQPRREDLPADQRHVWDEIAASRGSVRGPFSVMIHSPAMAQRAAHLGAYVRFEASIDHTLTELAALTTARLLDCDYEYAAHMPQGRKAGISETTLSAIERRQLGEVADEDRWLVNLVQQIIITHRVDEPTFDAAKQRLGLQGLVEVVGTAGYYAMLAATLNTFEVKPEES
jgi:4-carboxymuconolactone decarboxylase